MKPKKNQGRITTIAMATVYVNSGVSLNITEAIAATTRDLNVAMAAFDRWAAMNPEKLIPTDPDFKAMKQTIKLLRLRLKDQADMHQQYESTLAALEDETLLQYTGGPAPTAFTKSRKIEEVHRRSGMKLGSRPGIKLSRG